MYSNKRFFVVTGNHLGDTPYTIESRQEVIDAVHHGYFGERRKRTTSTVKSSGSAVTVKSDELCTATAGEASPPLLR